MYDWWKRRILDEAKTGHRYYCLMCLAIYARKAGINRKELEKDAFYIGKKFVELPCSTDNEFTNKDILASLEAYNDSYITYPISSISYVSGINIEKNKRNYRKQPEHLKIARFTRNLNYNGNNNGWINGYGRPKESGTKKDIIHKWQEEHPNGRKIDCERDLGVSRHTVLKWWK